MKNQQQSYPMLLVGRRVAITGAVLATFWIGFNLGSGGDSLGYAVLALFLVVCLFGYEALLLLTRVAEGVDELRQSDQKINVASISRGLTWQTWILIVAGGLVAGVIISFVTPSGNHQSSVGTTAGESTKTNHVDRSVPSGDGASKPSVDKAESQRTLVKSDFANQIAEREGIDRVVVKNVIRGFLDGIVDELTAGNRLEFRDFGTFEVIERSGRMAQNDETLEKTWVPQKRYVRFKVGEQFRERVLAMPKDPNNRP